MLEPQKLSPFIQTTISYVQNNASLFISAVTLWEISMLIHKKKINVYERTSYFLNAIAAIDGLSLIPLNAFIASESVMLPGGFYNDPADCMIIASKYLY